MGPDLNIDGYNIANMKKKENMPLPSLKLLFLIYNTKWDLTLIQRVIIIQSKG